MVGTSHDLCRYRPPEEILRIVRRILPRCYDHEAISQDIWIEAWQNAGSPPTVEIETKVIVTYGFIRNRCIDAARTRKRDDRLHHDLKDVAKPDPIDIDHLIEMVNIIMAKARLPHDMEKLIFLKFYAGLSLEMIARDMRLNLTAVVNRLAIALEELRRVVRIMGLEEEQS